MESYDFHRRQRVRREQERVHEHKIKTSASTYRMSLRALTVSPYIRRRDAERKRRRQTRESHEQASKVDLNASFHNSTQLNASPRNEAHRKNLVQRVKSFGKSGTASNRKTYSSRANESTVISNSMGDRSSSNRPSGEYIVPTPFTLPLEVKPPARKRPSFRAGKYFSPNIRSIMNSALADKRAAEKKLSKQACDISVPKSEGQDVAVVSETIEKNMNKNETPSLASTSRTSSFFRGRFSSKTVPSKPAHVTSYRKAHSSRSKVSVTNPMFDSGSSNRSSAEYVVPIPFMLPLEVTPPLRKRPPFKPGKYFSPNIRNIMGSALTDKRTTENKSNKKNSSDKVASENNELEEQDGSHDAVSVVSLVAAAVEVDMEHEKLSETIEEDLDIDESATLSSTGRAPSFLRGYFGTKSKSAPTSSVPTTLAWPAWITKSAAAKTSATHRTASAKPADISEQVSDTTEPQMNGIATWFNNLVKPSSDAGAPVAAFNESEDGGVVAKKPQANALGNWFNNLIKPSVNTPSSQAEDSVAVSEGDEKEELISTMQSTERERETYLGRRHLLSNNSSSS